jgi:hypothetical protein
MKILNLMIYNNKLELEEELVKIFKEIGEVYNG